MKGLDALTRHVPELNSTGGFIKIVLYFLSVFALTSLYFILTDRIPTWSIDSQILIMALGYLVLNFFFSRKKQYQEKYGELAYRKAFAHYAIPGLGIMLGAFVHAGYMNGPYVPRGWWTNIFVAGGWLFLITGAILFVRSVFTFGVDNATMLYVYYPQEGRIVNSSIYGILRHPLYAGALRAMIGLALLNGNGNSIVFALFPQLLVTGWLRLVEEKELIERFGQSYLDYRRRVPAFWPKLRDIGAYLRFLITGA